MTRLQRLKMGAAVCIVAAVLATSGCGWGRTVAEKEAQENNATAGGWCRFVGLVVDSITTNHATRPSSRRRSMMLMPNSVLIRLSRYQTM